MPGAPAASGGAPATCRRPQRHSTSCRSYWMVSARASGRPVTRPGSCPGGDSTPGTCPARPAACPACASSRRRGGPSARGGFLPGRSSAEGGIEEFPELREISRSRRATFSSGSAIFASLSSSSTRSRSFASRSLALSARSAAASPGTPGVPGTPAPHQSRPAVSNPARRAGRPGYRTPCSSRHGNAGWGRER